MAEYSSKLELCSFGLTKTFNFVEIRGKTFRKTYTSEDDGKT